MFNHHLMKRSLAAGLAIAASGFPAAAQAISILPANFHTDASSSGYVTPQASPSSASTPGSDAGTLPANFRTDASSGGYVTPQATTSSASVPQTSSGFQWADAGIGAAGAVVLLSAGALGASATRRRRRPVVG